VAIGVVKDYLLPYYLSPVTTLAANQLCGWFTDIYGCALYFADGD
jgi:hypothetical protein